MIRAQGKRHPLPALLSLAVVAMLAGMTSYEAIVDYGKERGWEFLQLLGFTRRRGLCKATYSRIFRRIDVAAFEAAVSRWICGRLKPGDTPHLAIDGKTLRGQPRRRDSRSPSLVRLRPGCRSRRGPDAGRCQDQRTEGGARNAGDLAHQGPPHHRRRHPDPSRDSPQ